MNKKNRFNVEEHTTLDNKIIDVFPISHRYIHDLEQQVKKQKEAIDRITEIINYYGIDKEHNDNLVLRNILKNMLDILKEVSE